MTSLKKFYSLKLIFALFFLIFVFLSFKSMIYVPFHDFDEAHRAENAKRMKEYKSYLVPLTGSSQDRVEHLKIPLRGNSDFYLYYHLERPPLVYLMMIISTAVFGTAEWVYRLPSFLFGMVTLFTFLFFAKKIEEKNTSALVLGFLTLITSVDLWLSSQFAQMDTGITLFLFLSLLTLIHFCSNRKNLLIYLSGIFFGLGLLSKLQPAVVFIFPVITLLILKKISISDLLKFILGFLLIFSPWVIYLILRFGVKDVLYVMSGFAITSASIIDIHQQAPFFWYMRWWWETLRPGWTIFLAMLIWEIFSKKLNWKKTTLLSYIFGGLLVFSIPINKIWWYVLPLIPALCFYIFLAAKDYLEEKPGRINSLSFAIVFASLPLFLKTTNKYAMLYGVFVTIITYLILREKITLKINLHSNKKTFFIFCVLFSLIFFLMQFPKITPYHWHTKPVAQYYKSLPTPKCLWLGDMPAEAALFYSNAGEIPLLDKTSGIFANCKKNYLITPQKYKGGEPLIRQGNMRLYKL